MRHSEPLSPEADDAFGKALEEVCNSILARADAERRGTDAWKKLWAASEHDLKSLADVVQKRFGLKHLSDKLYNLLKALPFAMWNVRERINDEQGLSCCADKARRVYYEEVLSCCADKARRVYYEEVLAEIKKIKESQ